MITITKEFLKKIQLTEQEFKTEMALWLFSNQKISFGVARKMAGMDIWKFQELLDERKIPLHYDEDDYRTDLKNILSL